MTRAPLLASVTASVIATVLVHNNAGQQATAYVFPSSMSTSNAANYRLQRSSVTDMSCFVGRRTALHSVVEENVEKDTLDDSSPEKNQHGIYDLVTKENHIALLAANPGKIVIMKFYAPWCRACKGLEPKFIQISKDPKYAKLPLVFAQMSVQDNKEYIKSLGVLALPSVHIYAGIEGLVENFPCGPSKVPILKKKIAQVVNKKVDSKTLELKPVEESDTETKPCAERDISKTTGTKTELSVGDVVLSVETMEHIRSIIFFKDMTEAEFSDVVAKSKYVTFEPGSVIMRQGKPGRTFYLIDSGEVETSVRGPFEDPLVTPTEYLGTAINRFGKGEFFGERSLITGQPRAASICATEKTRCFTFSIDDFPASTVLSGKSLPTADRLAQVDEKYGLDYYDIDYLQTQFDEANVANQLRGNPNRPETIEGVDIEGGINTEDFPSIKMDDNVLSLLLRFKLLRNAARCFEYIKKSKPNWGDSGDMKRRSLLVSKLTSTQRKEFTELFQMIDTSNDNKISVDELKEVLEMVDDSEKSNEELEEIINKADPSVNGNREISYMDFMGVMAEAEFYYLFKDTFSALDKTNSGYIQAGKIEKMLCGLRDLISDDRKSIIDMEDKDMLVDYESFAMMMIGTR